MLWYKGVRTRNGCPCLLPGSLNEVRVGTDWWVRSEVVCPPPWWWCCVQGSWKSPCLCSQQLRNGSWFVACINNAEIASEVTVDFSFLDGSYHALIYTDGADVSSVNTEKETVSSSTVKTFQVGTSGGFVIKLMKQ